MKLYSLYDCKADGFTPPFLAKNDEMAKRAIVDTCMKIGDCQLTHYPEDFTLFALAEWDEDKGVITPFACHFAIGNVMQLLNKPEYVQEETKEEINA